MGYGRHSCEQFPASSKVDAIRFHVAKDEGELIRIQYVLEQECWPGERGEFDYNAAHGLRKIADDTLRRQASAFVESYLKRRAQA